MVAQNQGGFVAHALQKARTFIGVNGDAFKVVVRHHVMQLCRVKVALLQAAFNASHRHARRGVAVHDAVRLKHPAVNGGMHGKACWVDAVV